MIEMNPFRDDPSRLGPTRRDVLRAGSLSILGTSLTRSPQLLPESRSRNACDNACIMIVLTGGPSHIDTWDPKPNAPEDIRGPFQAIATKVPGISISHAFPRLSTWMDRVSLVRSIHHRSIAVHETGLQLIQTGRLHSDGIEHPHIGYVVSRFKRKFEQAPEHVLLPGPIGELGGISSRGQSAGYLGRAYAALQPVSNVASEEVPTHNSKDIYQSKWFSIERRVAGYPLREAFDLSREKTEKIDRFGATRFGRNCLIARRLIERGVRFVTINMHTDIFDQPSWDIHGSSPFSSFDTMRDELCPSFDTAFTALLEDLTERGLFQKTVVAAFGEFGRSPRINRSAGRDHHPGCWTGLFAGGPIAGGRVIGESDSIGHSPKDRPVEPSEIVATILHAVGIPLDSELQGPGDKPITVVDRGVEPIFELF